MAYLPSASNCCSEVWESTVAPLRKVRIASRSSFSVAPLRLRMSATCPRSAISPSSRCSTDAYLSPKFRVKSTARWITFEESCEKNWSPPPSTLGRDATARSASSRRPRTFTPTRPRRNVASESSSRTSTLRIWSGSTACCPRSRARVNALCRASCAFTVNVLMFISLIICFLTFADYLRKTPANPDFRPMCHSLSLPKLTRGAKTAAVLQKSYTIRHKTAEHRPKCIIFATPNSHSSRS